MEGESWRCSFDITQESGLSQKNFLQLLHDDQLDSWHHPRNALQFPDEYSAVAVFSMGVRGKPRMYYSLAGLLYLHKDMHLISFTEIFVRDLKSFPRGVVLR
jgi:hypothetical protein